LGCPTGDDAPEGDGGIADDSSPEAGVCVRNLPTCPATPPSYAQTVQPIIAKRCVSCHFAGSTLAREDLSTYAGVFANRGTVLDQVYGCIMPPSDALPLAADEKVTLMTWLVCGAPNN
jgi:hypothetical protein